MGGSPFDKEGDDTYQLTGWAVNMKLTEVHFVVDGGDVTRVKLEIFDRPYSSDAKLLFSDEYIRVVNKRYPSVPLRGSKLGRLYIRLIALDGKEQNHCKAVFYGELLESQQES
jgi:hypothetical protein